MPESVDDLVFLVIENMASGIEILKNMISLQQLNVVICVNTGTNVMDIIFLFNKYKVNFIICSFPYFYHDLITYISIFPEINKLVKSKRCLNLSTIKRCISLFSQTKLSEFSRHLFVEKKIY